jgi:hypothetical protein
MLVALLALFIALGGGAYATSSNHTTIILRGPQGKQGKPGPPGPQGPANTCELEHHAQVGCVTPPPGPRGEPGPPGPAGREGVVTKELIVELPRARELEAKLTRFCNALQQAAFLREQSKAPGATGEIEHAIGQAFTEEERYGPC